jgi:hypothetical protein
MHLTFLVFVRLFSLCFREILFSLLCFETFVKKKKRYKYISKVITVRLVWVAQLVVRRPLNQKVRGLNPQQDTLALLLRRQYEFLQFGIN